MKKLGSPKTGSELLDHDYLNLRSALVEAAAGLDRIQKAEGGKEVMKDDPRVKNLLNACEIMLQEEANRAETILTRFSEPSS